MAMTMDDQMLELVVIGAGLYGINAALTYHTLNPSARLLIIDASPYPCGPWAPNRIFPGLKTNNLLGTFEHPDYPMNEAKFGVKKGEFVPAEKVYEYWSSVIEESGISPFLRLNSCVETVEKTAEGWRLRIQPTSPNSMGYTLETEKLILSTGTTNRPSLPPIPTSPSFTPPIIHSASFPAHYSSIVRPGTETLIIGGGKSAWDVAYACASKSGSTATMVIRPSGKGPIWMSPPYVTPLNLWLEKLIFTRFATWMSPCPWGATSGIEGVMRRFLHGTWLGRKIVGAFWSAVGKDVVDRNGYERDEEVGKLRPWRDAFEVGTALGIMNYDTDFFELVKQGRVQVVIGEVERFGEGREVQLSNGDSLGVDAVVCATGWESKSSIKFLPEGLERELGLPRTGGDSDEEEQALVRKVEEEIYARYPFLKDRDSSKIYHPDPSHRHSSLEEEPKHPYRLVRFMAPLSDLSRRSIGFAGALMSVGNASCAYVQSLWVAAYLDKAFPLPCSSWVSAESEVPTESQIKYETYLETQYCAIRHAMGYGNQFPDLVFDSLPYLDELLGDLAIQNKRKKGFRKECFEGYGPEDYRGAVEELRRMKGIWRMRWITTS